MGLLTFIQIPCHHVLANEIALNLKYRIDLKHFFNINLGIGIIKKTTFLFVFSTYLTMFLLKFRSGEIIRCRIKFRIQRVPTWHIMFFQVFLVFGVAGSIKSMSSGYSLDAEFISTSNKLSQLKFELKHGEIC